MIPQYHIAKGIFRDLENIWEGTSPAGRFGHLGGILFGFLYWFIGVSLSSHFLELVLTFTDAHLACSMVADRLGLVPREGEEFAISSSCRERLFFFFFLLSLPLMLGAHIHRFLFRRIPLRNLLRLTERQLQSRRRPRRNRGQFSTRPLLSSNLFRRAPLTLPFSSFFSHFSSTLLDYTPCLDSSTSIPPDLLSTSILEEVVESSSSVESLESFSSLFRPPSSLPRAGPSFLFPHSLKHQPPTTYKNRQGLEAGHGGLRKDAEVRFVFFVSLSLVTFRSPSSTDPLAPLLQALCSLFLSLITYVLLHF